MRRNISNNPALQSSLEEDGFALLPSLIGADEILRINDFFEKTNDGAGVGDLFYTSNWSKNYEYRRRTSEFLKEILSKKVLPLFDNYIAVYAHFMIKRPGQGSAYLLHQDWTIIDENKYTGITIWCPLIDVDRINGCMSFVAGSHEASRNIRGSNINTEVSNLPEDIMTNVELKAGDAVAFDQRIFHASGDNLSDKIRVAVGIVLIPREAKMIHYFRRPDTETVETYEVGYDFIEKFSVGDSALDHISKKIGEVPFENTKLNTDELISRLSAAKINR